MILRVYRNLRRAVWSLLDPRTGRVIAHADELVLEGVTFEVSEATRQRVIARHRRTVHAYARGTLVELPVQALAPERLHYNPYEAGVFTAAGQPILAAARVDFRRDGAYVVQGAA